jgi:hypothetical protein
MAQHWAAKAPTEIVERRWTVPLAQGDSISTVSALGTGVTATSDGNQLDDAVVVLSAGSAGTEASVVVTVTTRNGNTHVETFLVAIRAQAAALGNTVRDIAGFALRKITGVGETPEAAELADAVELLNGMLATWRIDGLDIGVAGVLTANDTLDVPDEFVLPVKYSLRRLCHSTYNEPLAPIDEQMAVEGRRLIANRLLDMLDLVMPANLTRRCGNVAEI